MNPIGRRGAAAFALALGFVAVAPGGLLAVDEPPETPTSLGQASIYSLQFATNIDGVPIDQGDTFAVGVPRVLTLVGWDYVRPGTELRVRLYQGERLVYEDARTVRTTRRSGYVYNFEPPGGVAEGEYTAELVYNGVPDDVASFRVTDDATAGPPTPAPANTDGQTGPIPYADPSQVLVVTREAALRERLGERTDDVLAAAGRVGQLVDLDDLGVDGTPEAAVPAVRDLLAEGGQPYALILGNDDVVPFVRVENPVASSEEEILNGWQLPADWLPSDDPYGNLDGDEWDVPEVGIARIPSSDDAELLLTQLADITPPDGGAFALVNQKRRGPVTPILETIDDVVPLDTHYTPPTEAEDIPATGAARARYTYVLLHGIGVSTDEWSADVVAWRPYTNDLNGEFGLSDAASLPGMTVAVADSEGGVVEVGACYGAWTLDTIQEPVHKTAENSLALDYLRSGTRAFIGDTHISYSYPIGLDGPYLGRTGFELAFWRRLMAGDRPIDAFLAAKRRTAQAVQELLDFEDVDNAAVALKTLRMMVYYGRP